MKAVRIFDFGGPEVLTFGDYPMPDVGSSDVLVRVEATSVSGFDLKYRGGYLHRTTGEGQPVKLQGRRSFPMPMQLGRDSAGIVEAVGEAVTMFRPGDRVVGMTHPANPNSLETIRGLGNLSGGLDIPGHTMFGGYAQYVARPEHLWMPLPDHVTFDDAASVMWAAVTSHRVVVSRLEVKLGDYVLVTGATGGMGLSTLRLAKLAGAITIATTRDQQKSEVLRNSGADHVVVTGDNVVRAVRDITGGRGVDGAVEYTGTQPMMRLCCSVMRLGGTVCLVGGEREALPLTVGDANGLELNVRGVRGGTPADQQAVWELLVNGSLRVPIDRVLPLSAVAEAHVLQDAGNLRGRIVLHPWP